MALQVSFLQKNRYAKNLGVDIEDLSMNEVIDIILETPRILKSPILVDNKRLQVGYKEDDIRAFFTTFCTKC